MLASKCYMLLCIISQVIKCTRAQIARYEYAHKPLYRVEARVQVLLMLVLACFQSVTLTCSANNGKIKEAQYSSQKASYSAILASWLHTYLGH